MCYLIYFLKYCIDILKKNQIIKLSFFSGSIGFFACFWFVRKIYSVVKVD